MILEEGLPLLLAGVPAIVAEVGSRVYGLLRPPDDKPPSIVITRAGTERYPNACGTDTLCAAEMQIDSWAVSQSGAWVVAAAVRAALLGYHGLAGEVEIDNVFLINEFPVLDPDPGDVRVTQLYTVWYVED